jgi:hypothetical protein
MQMEIPHNLSDFLRIHRRLFSLNDTLSETSTCLNILNNVEIECSNYFKPPLLVKRCNGSTAGLGYLEVGWIAHVRQ